MNKLEDDRKPMINPLSRVDREIISALNQLGQDGMADSYRMQAENVALYQDMPFEDRELDLIHGQQDYSRNKSCTALKKRAKLPDTRLIADLECNEGSGLSKKLLADLAALRWVSRRINIIITGSCGCGKTCLASALGAACCCNEISVSYNVTNTLLDDLVHMDYKHRTNALKRLAKTKVVILEDCGINGPFSAEQISYLYRIIQDREHTWPLIICSQYRPEAFLQLMKNGTGAEGFVDRLIHPCTEIRLSGDSFRKRASNRLEA